MWNTNSDAILLLTHTGLLSIISLYSFPWCKNYGPRTGHKSHILFCRMPILCRLPSLSCPLTHLSRTKHTVSYIKRVATGSISQFGKCPWNRGRMEPAGPKSREVSWPIGLPYIVPMPATSFWLQPGVGGRPLFKSPPRLRYIPQTGYAMMSEYFSLHLLSLLICYPLFDWPNWKM